MVRLRSGNLGCQHIDPLGLAIDFHNARKYALRMFKHPPFRQNPGNHRGVKADRKLGPPNLGRDQPCLLLLRLLAAFTVPAETVRDRALVVLTFDGIET